MSPRDAIVERSTKETTVRVELRLDGSGSASADTGLPFFDHMLEQLGTHAGFDLTAARRGSRWKPDYRVPGRWRNRRHSASAQRLNGSIAGSIVVKSVDKCCRSMRILGVSALITLT